MAIRIDDEFDVQSTPDRVWAFLIDPAKVVQCLPGAELISQDDERTFTGRIRVKVGPVTASFRGRATFEELDAEARRVRLKGTGQEASGGGAAKMTMTSTIEPLPGGGARVAVSSEVDVVGRLVQFGRGMMEEVSRQLFRQFADCVKAQMEGEAVTEASPTSPPPTDTSSAQRSAAQGDAPTPVRSAPLRAIPVLWAAIRSLLSRVIARRNLD